MRTLICTVFLWSITAAVYSQAADSACITMSEKKVVRGISLQGILSDGDSVVLLYNYYACNEVRRDEIAAIDYAGMHMPVIKLAKSIPGDTFHLVKGAAGVYYLEVNGQKVKDVNGGYYAFAGARYKMLKMYEDAYHGVMPADTYLFLGTVSGTTDSSRFGLVGRKELLGKITW